MGRLDALKGMDPEPAPRPSPRIDAALAVISAAIIAYGVLVLRWPVFIVMALFWFENVVIGGFNVLRMLVSGIRMGPAALVGACAMSAFFTLHYGLFTAVHGTFVVMMFGVAELGREALNGGLLPPVQRMLGHMVADRDGWLAMLAIVVVQAVTFVRWSVETREQPTPLKELMGAPYGRVMILHVTLIACGFLVVSLKAPVLGAVLLVVMKLVYDLVTLKNGPQQRGKRASQVQASRLLVAGKRKPG